MIFDCDVNKKCALWGQAGFNPLHARALANAPSVLLADEPTGNLDGNTADTVFKLLEDLVRKTGLGALVATHNLDLARRMDRVLRLENGAVRPDSAD